MPGLRTSISPLLCGAMLLAAAHARAFCRTQTCEADASCALTNGCLTGGAEAFWATPCLSYAVQRDGSPKLGLTAEQIHALLSAEFERWSTAPCGDGLNPAFLAQPRGDVACKQVEFNCDAGDRNVNIVMFMDRDWPHSPFEIALTTLSINTTTGEIFDADIEVNSEQHQLLIDPPPGDATDLRMVLAHELGHFLGLSHSNDDTALMREGGTPTPDLKPDDAAGVCAIFSHSAADPACRTPRSAEGAECLGSDLSCSEDAADTGCGCKVAQPRNGYLTLVMCALPLLWFGYRRRRAERARAGRAAVWGRQQ